MVSVGVGVWYRNSPSEHAARTRISAATSADGVRGTAWAVASSTTWRSATGTSARRAAAGVVPVAVTGSRVVSRASEAVQLVPEPARVASSAVMVPGPARRGARRWMERRRPTRMAGRRVSLWDGWPWSCLHLRGVGGADYFFLFFGKSKKPTTLGVGKG